MRTVVREVLLGLAMGFLWACPPQPKPTPPKSTDLAGQCTLANDVIPVACAGMFTVNGTPCAQCPVGSSCYWDKPGVWCVPECRQDDTCKIAAPDQRDAP
jgi:hypothetical protein